MGAAVASAGERTVGGAACEGSEARTVAEPGGKIVREASGVLSGGARAIGGRIAAPPAGVEGGVHSGGAIAMGGTRPTAGSHVQSADQTESSRQPELAPSESPMKTTTGTCECRGGPRGRIIGSQYYTKLNESCQEGREGKLGLGAHAEAQAGCQHAC